MCVPGFRRTTFIAYLREEFRFVSFEERFDAFFSSLLSRDWSIDVQAVVFSHSFNVTETFFRICCTMTSQTSFRSSWQRGFSSTFSNASWVSASEMCMINSRADSGRGPTKLENPRRTKQFITVVQLISPAAVRYEFYGMVILSPISSAVESKSFPPIFSRTKSINFAQYVTLRF